MAFLPVNLGDLQVRDWTETDIIIVTGDAYVDHPSFGASLISRYLERLGYKVGIIAQPQNDTEWLALGKPRLFWGVTAGNLDSMLNHYTAQRKLRSDDAYSPEGVPGRRPDRATIVYCNHIRRLDKEAVIVIGGIEASLRRIAHFDFWSDTVRNSILVDAKADVLVYGMGENPIKEIAIALDKGNKVCEISNIKGTVIFAKEEESVEHIMLPDSDRCKDKHVFRQMTIDFGRYHRDHVIYQKNGNRLIRHNPPSEPLSQQELDGVYELPYEYSPHPMYEKKTIPAYVQIKDSLTSHRGCFGGCRFCTLSVHQGRVIQSRSEQSIISEVTGMTQRNGFKGIISDIGGPTANMYGTQCNKGFPVNCHRTSCLYPQICRYLSDGHGLQLTLYRKVRQIKGVKHLFIASGIRHDLALRNRAYIKQIARNYTGGRIKLAPEHVSKEVLKLMNKPSFDIYQRFASEFESYCHGEGLVKKLTPYLIVGYPGTTIKMAMELGNWLRDNKIKLEQVQEFTPTPMTIATCMYYTGLDYDSGKPIEVPKGRKIRLQKGLAFWYDPKWQKLIGEAKRMITAGNKIGVDK